MGEVGLRNADKFHQGVLHRTIQGLPVPEQLQYKERQVGLSKAYDAVVDDHETGEEDQNSPYDVDINVVNNHFLKCEKLQADIFITDRWRVDSLPV